MGFLPCRATGWFPGFHPPHPPIESLIPRLREGNGAGKARCDNLAPSQKTCLLPDVGPREMEAESCVCICPGGFSNGIPPCVFFCKTPDWFLHTGCMLPLFV